MKHKVYLSVNNLKILLAKLDLNIVKEGTSECTIIKRDTAHKTFPQTIYEVYVKGVEGDESKANRHEYIVNCVKVELARPIIEGLINLVGVRPVGHAKFSFDVIDVVAIPDKDYYVDRKPGAMYGGLLTWKNGGVNESIIS